MKRTKKHLAISTLFTLLSLPLNNNTAAERPIYFTMAGPITGSQTSNGFYMRIGFEAAISLINQRGGIEGRPVRLIVEDDACSPREAVSVAGRVTARTDRFLYGHFCSTSTLAAMNTYKEADLIQLTISQADPITNSQNRHSGLFRINVNNAQLVAALAQNILSVGQGDVVLVYEQGAFGQNVRDNLIPSLTLSGLNIFPAEFNEGDRDFSSMATRILAQGVSRIVIAANGDKIGMIIRELRSSGYTGLFFTPGTGTLSDVGHIAQCAADGTYSVTVGVDRAYLNRSPDIQHAFNTRSVEPNDSVLISFAAAEVLSEAIRRAGTSSNYEKIRLEIQNGQFETVMGRLSWNQNGDLRVAPTAIYRWSCASGVPSVSPVP